MLSDEMPDAQFPDTDRVPACSAYPNRTNLTRNALDTTRRLVLEAATALPELEEKASALDAPTLLANQQTVIGAVKKLRKDMEWIAAVLAVAAVDEGGWR